MGYLTRRCVLKKRLLSDKLNLSMQLEILRLLLRLANEQGVSACKTLSEVWRKGQEQWSWDLGKNVAKR